MPDIIWLLKETFNDYLTAEKLLKQAFNAAGVNPTFNLEYREHINNIE